MTLTSQDGGNLKATRVAMLKYQPHSFRLPWKVSVSVFSQILDIIIFLLGINWPEFSNHWVKKENALKLTFFIVNVMEKSIFLL